MSTVELTRFRVRSGHGAELVRLPGDQWLDIVWWRSPGDLAASRAKGANLPGIEAFFAAIDELISSEEGERADPRGARGAEDGQGGRG
jgi:hypothetical protein